MAKESIKGLRKIAEQSGYSCWQDYLYDYCLNGNDILNILSRMSKKDTLDVLDAIVFMMMSCHKDESYWDVRTLHKMYLGAFSSLHDRL